MAKNSLIQTQGQTQIQTQSLSPQQVLVARLLELTNIELEDRVRSEVMDNPALETVEPEVGSIEQVAASEHGDDMVNSADDYRVEDDVPDYNGWDYRPQGDYAEEIPVASGVSFGDTLMEQLGELSLDENEQIIGEYLIGSLDEDGLLHKPLSEIEDELIIYYGLDTDSRAIERVLKMIQTFDPAGIAARSLQESLLLQLERYDGNNNPSLPKRIITDYYDEFAKKHWDTLADKLGVSAEECREAIAEIVRLNPRPGASLAEGVGPERQQIIPDFIIDVQGEMISVALNNMYVPELRVSNDYINMLDEQVKSGSPEHKAAALFLKQKIESAKGFISAVRQREQTLLDTIRAIVGFQQAFLHSGGDEAQLKPMILEDIAKKTGYDISTVSRVSNSKYAQLPWGIFPLKYFFNDGVVTADGGEKSVRELYRSLKELVDAEDKSNPLTDTELMEKLQEQGYTMARRTVAKYREHLHIPVARLRKE
ncbi:MAG: RNA polymerase factor sigma-54 [Bacteroidaceae bacterium]|nr:RNA polymerase factor sigma-54 [Bacteroidaceae bacterium]